MTGSVLKTLAYADIFDYPLSKEEIEKWLITAGTKETKDSLQDLLQKGAVWEKDGFYFLKGRKDLVLLRKKREKSSQKKYALAQKTAERLALVPWIKMVGITGALSMNNTETKDDIDLMIVTASTRLWLTRLLIYVLSPFLGIRRRKPKDKEVKNKICFNLFLEESHLKISPENLFLAHEICQVKPVLDRDQTYQQFLSENEWVKKFLPNALETISFQPKIIEPSRFFSFLEKFAFQIQYLYMKPKITHEKISLHQAFFHPRDLSQEIDRKLKERLKEI